MKKISNYTFAIYHALGVVIFAWIVRNIITNTVSDLFISKLGAKDTLEFFLSWKGNIIKLIIWAFTIFVGVLLSLWTLKKKYIFENGDKAIKISAIFFIVITLVRDLIQSFILFGGVGVELQITTIIIWDIINIGVLTFLFYWLTKAKIKKMAPKNELRSNY